MKLLHLSLISLALISLLSLHHHHALASSHFEGFDAEDDDISEDSTELHHSLTPPPLTQSQSTVPDPEPDSTPITKPDPPPTQTGSKKLSFDHWDEDEFEGLPVENESTEDKSPPIASETESPPDPSEDTDTPEKKKKKLSSFTVEIVFVSILIAYLINYFLGKRANETLALAWASKFALKDAILEKNFSLLGVGEGEDSPLLLKEAINVFKFYASGRSYCHGLLATLELKSRHDLISRLLNFVVPCKDEIEVEVYMNDEGMDHVVFALARKKAAKGMLKEMRDLQRQTLNSAAMAPSVQGEWIKVEQKGGKTPGPRSSHGIAVVGDKLYSFGGELTPNISIDKDLYVFDFNTHTWSIAPSNGVAPDVKALGTRMVSVGTKLYLFGGRDENKKFDDFYSYDTVTNEWTKLTILDQEGGPEARTYHSMASDENHVYVFGGVSKGGTDKTPFRFRTIEAYNIADAKWAQLPDPGEQFPRFERRGGAGFAVVQGKIWVVYGFATSPDPHGKNDYESDQVQFYDPATQKWTEVETKGDKPSARSVFGHAVVGKYILIFGGETWPDPKAHLGPGTLSDEGFALDTETLVWERFGGGAEPGKLGWPGYTTATVYGKKGLLIHGGKRPTNNRTDELYFYAVNSA